MREALEELADLADAPIIPCSTARAINGHLYGRWLCKCFCGATTAHDLVEPSVDFLRYAFAEPVERRVHFYFPQRIGERTPLGRERGGSLTTLLADEATYQGFILKLWGLPCLVADETTLRLYQGVYEPMINRIARIEIASHGPGGPNLLMSSGLRINFDWSGDPPLEP